MSQAVEDLVQKLLADPEFLKDQPEEARRSAAYGIANKQLSASLDPIIFSAAEGEVVYSLVRGADGSPSMLVFKNARLASAEINLNRDRIDAQGVKELAATIAGWPIDLEHQHQQVCGMFTAGRVGAGDVLLVDGAVWADRYPQAAQSIMDGSAALSVEARADKAGCSICNEQFESADAYCEHLPNRRTNGAVRNLSGLKARGGAITNRPAGTNTRFDPNHIYIIAAHQDESAPSSGSMHDDTETHQSTMKESTMTEDEVNKIKADLEAALKKISDLEAAVAEKEKVVAEKDKTAVALAAKLADSEAGRVQLQASARRAKLGTALTDEEWGAQKEAILAMPEPVFDLMASKMAAPKVQGRTPVLTLSGGSDDAADRLTLH